MNDRFIRLLFFLLGIALIPATDLAAYSAGLHISGMVLGPAVACIAGAPLMALLFSAWPKDAEASVPPVVRYAAETLQGLVFAAGVYFLPALIFGLNYSFEVALVGVVYFVSWLGMLILLNALAQPRQAASAKPAD